MNTIKEQLILDLIECRIQNIRNNSMEEEWMADVMNFGWVGYESHSDEELIQDAENMDLEDIPTLEELRDETNTE